MNPYDVPRQTGLYWVIWDLELDPEPTIAEQSVCLSTGINVHGNRWETLHKDWARLGSDEGYDPDVVLGGPVVFAALDF